MNEKNAERKKEKTGTIYWIQGIYGHVEIPICDIVENQDGVKATWDKRCDVDFETGEEIEGTDATFEDGLPLGLTKDDYFRIALLDKLGNIADALRGDNYVKVKEPINVTINNSKGLDTDMLIK